MKPEIILNTLVTICNQCEICGLDTEIFHSIPAEEGRIGVFFVDDTILYRGHLVGKLNFYPLGRCSELKRIFYRLYEEDELIDFCFVFDTYKVIAEYDGNRATDVMYAYIDEKLVENQEEVKAWIYKHINESSSD